jgi:hypothetical protein
VGVLLSLTRPEVQLLSDSQFVAVRKCTHQYAARGNVLLSGITAGMSWGEQLFQLPPGDVNALAWRLHTQPTATDGLVMTYLTSAASVAASQLQAASLHEEAVMDMAAAFALEREVARLNCVSQPDQLLAGER